MMGLGSLARCPAAATVPVSSSATSASPPTPRVAAVAAAANTARELSAKNMRSGTDEHGRRIRMFTATLTCDRAEKAGL
jgi:hypothetical protein